MELERGVCNLCLEKNKVFSSADSEEFVKLLPPILPEDFLSETEFQKIKASIKICVLCCYKIQAANQIKTTMKNSDLNLKTNLMDLCHFCRTDKYLAKINNDYKYCVERTAIFLNQSDFPVCICTSCFFYFDVIFNFKMKLIYKFPQLGAPKKPKSSQKQNNDTPKRKSLSKSPPNTKKRKIFDNCFTYLQPLCNNNYYVDNRLKKDTKLYKKVAYINLADMKDVSDRETTKIRPIIKIKLKRKPKRVEKEKKLSKVANEVLQEHNLKSKPYIKLCKSEEIPHNVGPQKSKVRRHSTHVEQTDLTTEPEEKIDETPKAASIVVPKRRVSLFVESNENEPVSDINTEDINKIVENYIATETSFSDNDKLELIDQIEKNDVEKNGIEQTLTENSEDCINILNQQIDDRNNENKIEEIIEGDNLEDNQKNFSNEDASSLSSNESTRKTPQKNSSSSESSDSDTSEKYRNKSNLERDSLNGSERKKKRVTFSDEIN